LDRQPSEIPAKIDVLQRLGCGLNAARLGITRGRISNVKSMVRRAMTLTGHAEAARRLDFPLKPTWKALADAVGDPRSRILLRRLFRIFQLKGIARPPSARRPSGPSATTSTSRSARRQVQGACPRMESLERLAAAVPDLIIEVPNRRSWFSLRLDQLPSTLAADISNWLSADRGIDPRLRRSHLNGAGHPHRRPIRPCTAASYR
jgi:hypothetical protein